MKAIKMNLSLLILPVITLFTATQCSASIADSLVYENDSVFTIDSYKDELSKDGQWLKVEKEQVDPDGVTSAEAEYDDDINYEYVWRPYGVGPEWSPYTNGYWVYTNCGWMWVSYYQWGWRTCHYGRWWWSPVWGWVWSPGFVWAPAWVVWMYNGDYCGWYPISPRIRWHHHNGWRCHHMRFHVRHWTFTHTSHYTSPINPIVIVDPPGNKNIIDKATFVNDINVENGKVINKGPVVQEIEKATGRRVVTEDVTKYNNAKVITSKEERGNEKQFENEKWKNERQTENEKNYNNEKQRNDGGKNNGEKNWNGNNEKKQNDGGKKAEDKNYNNENQRSSEKKSNNNDGVKKEKTYEQPKNYNPPEKKQSYDKPKDNNSGEKKQTYESPKKNNDGNNNSKRNDTPKKDDPPKNKSDGQDGGKGNDNGKQKGNK